MKTADIDFDEEWYLSVNPDVAAAVRAGRCPSGWDHYRDHGQGEGRRPRPGFDAEWYAKAYPTVVGETGSAEPTALERHYNERGQFRGYLPNPQAVRPRNPATARSPFGGLWIDAANVLDLIDGRRKLGFIDTGEADLLTIFATQGYVVLREAVPASLIDAAEAEIDAAYRGRKYSSLRFECPAVSDGLTTWREGVAENVARAIDLHWFSPELREAIFSPRILRFLHLIFERPVLAAHTLTFYRGSQQPIHQDTAYVPFSLPLHFAATWIAIEDIAEGTGELEYFVDSHRKLPDFLYGGMHKSVHEAGRLGAGDNILRHEIQDHLSAIETGAEERGLPRERFLARRGDALVWHSELAHGGRPTPSSKTRKSLVTHYCPSEIVPLCFESGDAVINEHASGSLFSSSIYRD